LKTLALLATLLLAASSHADPGVGCSHGFAGSHWECDANGQFCKCIKDDPVPVTICDATTRGTHCRTVLVSPPVADPSPAPQALAQPVWCELRIAYDESSPDVTNVAAPIAPACSEDRARAALSSKLNDLLLGERLPR
jgi:hypothetical protein